jgi:ABA4-like protein
MTAAQVFSIANLIALTGWLVLIIVGRKMWVAPLVTGAILPLLFAALYSWLVISYWSETKGGFGSLADVRMLFSNEWILLAGWVHYLAFDLFIGSWEVRDAQHFGIPHWAVIPSLILTFLFGPVGLLLYFVIRTLRIRKLNIEPRAAD